MPNREIDQIFGSQNPTARTCEPNDQRGGCIDPATGDYQRQEDSVEGRKEIDETNSQLDAQDSEKPSEHNGSGTVEFSVSRGSGAECLAVPASAMLAAFGWLHNRKNELRKLNNQRFDK